MITIADIQHLDDATMLEVAQRAAAGDLAIIERAGEIRFCSAERIPAGWHRVGAASKVRTPAEVRA